MNEAFLDDIGINLKLFPAAISHCYKHNNFSERKLLVIDIGGGSTELSIIRSSQGVFNTLTTSGSRKLCGEAFDDRIMKHFKKEIAKKQTVQFTEQMTFQLLKVAEKAKRILTGRIVTVVKEQIVGLKLQTTLKREKFESLSEDLFSLVLELIDPILIDAKLEKGDIDKVILAGGCSQIPKIKRLIETFFGKKKVTCVNPKERVACGAGNF